MPVVKKSAKADAKSPVVKDEPVERKVYAPPPAPVFKREAVTFADSVLTVDLTALDALPQGKRQAAVKVARTVLDRASQ